MMICICGGDMRMVELANLAARQGDSVRVLGFDAPGFFCEGVRLCKKPEAALTGCDRVILPLPVSRDREHLFAPFFHEPLPLSYLWPLLQKVPLVFGGRISPTVREDAGEYNIVLRDYLDREEFAVANAVPTAEGAVQIAMEQLKCTLAGTRCLVLGYGRVGMVLANLLQGMHVSVTVSCRKHGALALAKAMGNHPLPLQELPADSLAYTVIFNTIPASVLPAALLAKCPPETLLIELASPPGGIDLAYCRKNGLKALNAQALPGRVAPVTGARIIFEIVSAMAEEHSRAKEETP